MTMALLTTRTLTSLHAITGISSSTTMHLGVTLANTHIRALVDSGSTHCFVATATAHRLGLEPLPRPGLTVGVTNRDRIACTGFCPAVPISIGSERFVIDMFISHWAAARWSWVANGSVPSSPSCGTSSALPCPFGAPTTASSGLDSTPVSAAASRRSQRQPHAAPPSGI
jgi:hypothetical protein